MQYVLNQLNRSLQLENQDSCLHTASWWLGNSSPRGNSWHGSEWRLKINYHYVFYFIFLSLLFWLPWAEYVPTNSNTNAVGKPCVNSYRASCGIESILKTKVSIKASTKLNCQDLWMANHKYLYFLGCLFVTPSLMLGIYYSTKKPHHFVFSCASFPCCLVS